jgi:hypothetical protein
VIRDKWERCVNRTGPLSSYSITYTMYVNHVVPVVSLTYILEGSGHLGISQQNQVNNYKHGNSAKF